MYLDKKPGIKTKIKQFFCKHKNVGFFRLETKFHHLHGEVVYTICEDCGKILKDEFMEWEELQMRFKEYR